MSDPTVDILAIDLDADGGEIALVENAVDKAAHQAGFADTELPHHADLFLQHARDRATGRPVTRNDALRQNIRSSSLTAEQVSFSRSSGTAVRRAAGTPNATSAARTFSARDRDSAELNCFRADRIVIAAHFDLNGLTQGRGGLDERDHLGTHVFQEETLFGRDLGAAGHEAEGALLQLVLQFGELALSGKAGNQRMIFLPVELDVVG